MTPSEFGGFTTAQLKPYALGISGYFPGKGVSFQGVTDVNGAGHTPLGFWPYEILLESPVAIARRGNSGGPANNKVPCLPNVGDFVNSNLTPAQTLANELPNGTTAQEILATAGKETGYGGGLAAYGNYFGLHGTGFAGQTGTYTTSGGVLTPRFPLSNGFLLSGQVFVNTEAPHLAGVNASSPQTFFQTIHANGYGTTNPNYVKEMMQNTPQNHGPYALVGACLPRGAGQKR
jgi:hypothetical protein